jgi:hypothetical protein
MTTAALARVADDLSHGRPPTETDARMVARVLLQIVAGDTASTAIATALRERRDNLLRAMWRRHYPAAKITAAAAQLGTDALRYEASAWRTDRLRPCPHPPGTLRRDLWHLLQSGSLPQQRRIIDILSICATEPYSDCTETGPV